MTYYHNGQTCRPADTFRIGAEIRRLHGQGYTPRDIGSMLGVDENAIRSAIKPIDETLRSLAARGPEAVTQKALETVSPAAEPRTPK